MDMEEKPKYGTVIPGLHLLEFVVKVCDLMFFRDPLYLYVSKQKLK